MRVNKHRERSRSKCHLPAPGGRGAGLGGGIWGFGSVSPVTLWVWFGYGALRRFVARWIDVTPPDTTIFAAASSAFAWVSGWGHLPPPILPHGPSAAVTATPKLLPNPPPCPPERMVMVGMNQSSLSPGMLSAPIPEAGPRLGGTRAPSKLSPLPGPGGNPAHSFLGLFLGKVSRLRAAVGEGEMMLPEEPAVKLLLFPTSPQRV